MRAPWIVGLALFVASPNLHAATATPAPRLPDPASVAAAHPTVPTTSAGEPNRLQPGHDWNSLATLRPGQHTAVVTKRQRVLQGRFEGHTAEAIMLVIEGEPVSVGRLDVAEVLSLEHSNRARNTMLSWGTGLAVGLLVGMGGDASTNENLVTDMAASLSTGTGRAVHAMLPRHKVIYRAPGPRP